MTSQHLFPDRASESLPSPAPLTSNPCGEWDGVTGDLGAHGTWGAGWGQGGADTSPGWQGRVLNFTASPGVGGGTGWARQEGGVGGGDGEKRSDLGGI